MQKLSLKTKIFNFFREIAKIPLIERFLVKQTQNKTLENFFVKFLPNNYQYLPNTIRQATRNEIIFRLDISDYMEYVIYYGLITEPREKLYNLIKDKWVVFDIGTNIGETLLNFAKLNPNGQNYGFEPVPYLFERASTNIQLNHFKNINLNNIALSDRVETLYFEMPNNQNSGGISMQKNQSSTSISVNALKLDDFFEQNALKKIDFIKIDVEGFELNVLKGAKETLAKYHPQLFIEINDKNLKAKGGSAKELIDFLLNLNYQILHAETDESINLNFNFANKHFDIIAT